MSQLAIIDGIQFARSASEQQGELGAKQFSRLVEAGCHAGELRYRLRGATNDQRKPCLQLAVTGALKLTCQRCLGELDFAVSIESQLELSDDFKSIAEADDEVDRVLADRAMSVVQLVEDEIILALPMVPSHVTCTAGATPESLQAARQSPFRVLAGLKRGL